ncbi:hypothetical protein B0I27_10779 [Arcticibacter pallidicorallinus]|uniref:Uncharacterized protein n=1 Tax=Arcticibacter pallidicorallinus TaxID=1259464 RepID=A0A2T0U0R0_9SPHI|nr:hypothetical protein [Arcticibacter pallidicorallinus]PRY51494.1 hypothetical protein B0I27_10779 [Arcticibacter pallidicorallinus]
MQVSPQLLAEIYKNLEHGEMQGIANQLGGNFNRQNVRKELTTLKDDYNELIINAAITRIEARGVVLKFKEEAEA